MNDTILGCLQDNPNNPNCPDSLLVYITAWPTYDTQLHDSRCWTGQAGHYTEHGFDFEYTVPDTTYIVRRELDSSHGCDSIVTLTLVVGDFETYDPEVHYLCYETEPSFTWAVNNQTYHADGFYADTLPAGDCYAIYNLELHFLQAPQETHLYDTTCSAYDWEISGHTYHLETSGDYPHYDYLTPFPCVKTTWLHLEINGSTENPFPEVIIACDSAFWNGHVYTKTGPYTTTLQTSLGCDSIVHLDLIINHTPTPSNILISDDPYPYHDNDTVAVITNTEFFSFNYDFYVEDLHNNLDEWDSCVWNISKASWIIQATPENSPRKTRCKVSVAEHSDSLVELRCTVYNSNCLSDSIVRKVYLKSSFFGLDDHEANNVSFNVIPNPNNGQMQLHFVHLSGPMNIKVYDMRGAKIDEFETEVATDDFHYTYQIRQPKAGIYYFVVTGQGQTLSQKALIIP